jgi:hypothetical protein
MSDLSASISEFNFEVTSENIKTISDDVLFNKLKYLGVNVGPIMPSTRHLYEKKLLNVLGLNTTVVSVPVEEQSQIVEKTPVIRKSPKKQEAPSSPRSNKVENVEPISISRPSSSPCKPAEIVTHETNLYQSSTNNNLNDSFENYSKKISSIRSRAPLHSDKSDTSNFFF